MMSNVKVDPLAVTTRAEESPGEPDGALRRGVVVGRYHVVDHVGAGGMGSVYSAYDPELDRRIALTMLHASTTASGSGGDSVARRIVNEAKAMARLSHPNVVTVHDVLVAGDQVLIAMELVDGESLRDWLERAPRTWREVVAVYAQAGRGLAAAHAAGIVHRDFKPDNVLVGKDGRARVADFRAVALVDPGGAGHGRRGGGAPDGVGAASGSLESSLEGTPRYMAPEQITGERPGAAADQFAFCVSLWEALFGVTPFEGNDLVTILRHIRAGERQDGPARGVPGWLRRVVARGLAPTAAERHPSMEALVDALERDPRRAWRRVAALAAGVVGVAAVASGFALHRRSEVRTCRAIERRLDGVWDGERRGAAEQAFAATGRPYAQDTFERTARILDDYAARWKAGAVAACEGPAEPKPIAAQRSECFGARLGELRALGGALVRADSDTIEHAVHAAGALSAIDACKGSDPLGDVQEPGDPAVRADADAVRDDLRVLVALRAVGRFEPERAASDVSRAEQIGFGPLTAEALVVLGELQSEGNDPASAEQTLRRAAVTAEASGASRSAARAWLDRAALASEKVDYATADERFDFATAWVDRLGDTGALRGELLLVRGERLSDGGDNDQARALHLEALATLDRARSDLATRRSTTSASMPISRVATTRRAGTTSRRSIATSARSAKSTPPSARRSTTSASWPPTRETTTRRPRCSSARTASWWPRAGPNTRPPSRARTTSRSSIPA